VEIKQRQNEESQRFEVQYFFKLLLKQCVDNKQYINLNNQKFHQL